MVEEIAAPQDAEGIAGLGEQEVEEMAAPQDAEGIAGLGEQEVEEMVAPQDAEGIVGPGEQEVEEMAKEVAAAMQNLNCQCSVGPENMTNSLYCLFARAFLVHLFDGKVSRSFVPVSLAWLLQPGSLMTGVSKGFLYICCTFVDVA